MNWIALLRVATALSKALRERHRPKTYTTSWNNPSVPIPEGRHSVVQRRFRLFIRSGTYGKMRPWLTLANHTNTIRRMEQCQEDAPTKDASDNPIDPRAFGLAKAAYGVGETLDMLSIGRTSLYAAVKRGDLKRVKFGKKTLFYAADLASFLTKLGRLSEADAHRVSHAPGASKSTKRS
jgi:hypothetical protein